MPQSKSVTKKDSSDLVTASFYDSEVGTGFEETDKDDFAIPFVRIIQSLSPQVQQSKPEYLPDAKPGLFVNTVSGELAENIQIVPIHYERKYMEWIPRKLGGGLAAIHDKIEGMELVKQLDADFNLPNGNKLMDTRSFFVLVNFGTQWEKAVISLTSTQIKKAKGLMQQMSSVIVTNAEGRKFTPPMFANLYTVKSVAESNSEGEWFGWSFSRDGLIEDEELYLMAKNFRSSVTSGDVKVDESQAEAF